jgi:endonuclease/exonuclease/phosphatase family metal-dependent hydrolase
VICGDFNVEPGSETFDILARGGIRDLVTGQGHPGTRTDLYARPGRFADYLLVNAAARPKAFEVVRRPVVSDHCALVLDI